MTEEDRMTLTIQETAKVLGLSRNNVYGLVAEGKIPSIRLGKRLLVPKKSLQLLLDCGGHRHDDAQQA